MYGGAGVPQALPLPVQGDVGRQLRVFWTGAEGQQVSGLATVVQEAAGMANVHFTEGGEDRWYTLRKDSMTIAEDGSNFEWTDRKLVHAWPCRAPSRSLPPLPALSPTPTPSSMLPASS